MSAKPLMTFLLVDLIAVVPIKHFGYWLGKKITQCSIHTDNFAGSLDLILSILKLSESKHTDANLYFTNGKIEDQEDEVVSLLCCITNHKFSGQ